MKLYNKLFFFFVLLSANFLLAEDGPPAPPPGGGGGGVGPGAPASPIDMYLYVLALVGVLLIAAYSKKLQRKAA